MSDPRFGRASGYIVHGTVVDINDPQQSGQVKVKWNLGAAAQDKLSKEDVPWTKVMMPGNSASLNQAGKSATGLRVGSRVVGMPMDASGQDYIITGTMYASGTSTPDQEFKSDSDIPRSAKEQKQDGVDQPRYGDVNDVAKKLEGDDVVRTSITQYAREEGGPDKKAAEFADLPDSVGWADRIE